MDILTIKELCAFLNISRKFAYDFIINNNIQYKMIGKKYFISKKSILNYLEGIIGRGINYDGENSGKARLLLYNIYI